MDGIMAKLSMSRVIRRPDSPKPDLDVVDIPNPIGPLVQEVFQDPRDSSDRRRKSDFLTDPSTGCRRKKNRRSTIYIKNDEWWMKRNYNNFE